MAADPVCLTPVDEDDAQYIPHYKGQDYSFCSGFCKQKFDENPKRYARTAWSVDIGSDITCRIFGFPELLEMIRTTFCSYVSNHLLTESIVV